MDFWEFILNVSPRTALLAHKYLKVVAFMLDNAENSSVTLFLPHVGVSGGYDRFVECGEAGIDVGIETVSGHTIRKKICPRSKNPYSALRTNFYSLCRHFCREAKRGTDEKKIATKDQRSTRTRQYR
ncbi:hypothetical protein MnTg02_00882 [bacterium MnTg02]|nr:hypothetical protein MnTg02_00882 [bacterium MnTg02]